MIAKDSVRFAYSGPSPCPMSGGGHASAITTIHPLDIRV